jgi:glutaredoxin
MEEKIILYSTDTCHRCKMVKQILNIHNVQYVEVTDIDLMKNKCFNEVPMMEINDRTLDYGHIVAWLKKNDSSLIRGDRHEST